MHSGNRKEIEGIPGARMRFNADFESLRIINFNDSRIELGIHNSSDENKLRIEIEISFSIGRSTLNESGIGEIPTGALYIQLPRRKKKLSFL